jgi:hypothetical protein
MGGTWKIFPKGFSEERNHQKIGNRKKRVTIQDPINIKTCPRRKRSLIAFTLFL